MNKSYLRQHYQTLRAQQEAISFSQQAVQSFLSYIQDKTCLGLFYPFGDEIDVMTLPVTIASALPRIVDNNQMQFHQWQAGQEVEVNRHGIFEPLKTASICVPEVVLMPLLACDEQGNRLGYGGGYYDRYLATHPNITRIGVGYSCQLSEQPLPHEVHDIPMNAFLSPSGLIEFNL